MRNMWGQAGSTEEPAAVSLVGPTAQNQRLCETMWSLWRLCRASPAAAEASIRGTLAQLRANQLLSIPSILIQVRGPSPDSGVNRTKPHEVPQTTTQPLSIFSSLKKAPLLSAGM